MPLTLRVYAPKARFRVTFDSVSSGTSLEEVHAKVAQHPTLEGTHFFLTSSPNGGRLENGLKILDHPLFKNGAILHAIVTSSSPRSSAPRGASSPNNIGHKNADQVRSLGAGVSAKIPKQSFAGDGGGCKDDQDPNPAVRRADPRRTAQLAGDGLLSETMFDRELRGHHDTSHVRLHPRPPLHDVHDDISRLWRKHWSCRRY